MNVVEDNSEIDEGQELLLLYSGLLGLLRRGVPPSLILETSAPRQVNSNTPSLVGGSAQPPLVESLEGSAQTSPAETMSQPKAVSRPSPKVVLPSMGMGHRVTKEEAPTPTFASRNRQALKVTDEGLFEPWVEKGPDKPLPMRATDRLAGLYRGVVIEQ